MLSIFGRIADVVRESRADIFDIAFASLDWNEVYIHLLKEEQFRVVKATSESMYQALQQAHLNDEQTLTPVEVEHWQEYLKMMAADPRTSAQ